MWCNTCITNFTNKQSVYFFTNILRPPNDNIYEFKIRIMSYESPNREWLIAEIESELGNIGLDLDAWSTSELEDMYNNLMGSL